MSGFFGIVRSDGAAVQRELLEGIARRLEFRGQDGTSVWTGENAGFCFTFLDTGTPHQARLQPVSLSERFILTGEVRLDERKELIASLRDHGQPAGPDASDQELLLQAWKAWAAEALVKIAGDFSFGLWDSQAKSLTCARDFAGVRPFYYAQGPGVFCFSNTLRVLRDVPGISSELDERFVRDFLLEGQCRDADRTVWRAIRRLLPGHCLHFSSGKLDVQRFLRLPIEEPLTWKDPEEYLEHFRELLQLAVADRLPEGKASLYLSGGLDSSSVCAMAGRVAPERIASGAFKAFTVSWRPLMDDPEPEVATRAANYLGLAHEILQEEEIRPDSALLEAIPPEPTAELFFGRACRLYRAISAHARVVLSGDGGDNVLDGQAWPYLNYLWRRGEWKEIGRSFAAYTVTHGQLPALRGGFRTRLLHWFRPDKEVEKTPAAWLNEEFARRTEPRQEMEAERRESLPVHPVHPHAYQGLHSGYWGSVLEEEEVGWTGANLESRAPFLDLRLLKFLLRLPPVPWCMHKELTRRSMRGRLPVEILARPKTPLVQEPLQMCQQKAGWHPVPPKSPPKRLQEFVKWSPWLATLESSKGLSLWENLYPLALAYWLKAIEKAEGIE
jgi:asparagine synthase (glutamine-hydrolysing)